MGRERGLSQKFIDEALTEQLANDVRGPSFRVKYVARLTSLLGILLFLLLAVEGISIPIVSKLMTLHVLVGMILVPVMALKIAVTSYRFTQYYLKKQDFVNAGPPWMPLRLIAPLIIFTTVVMMASGIELALTGPKGLSFTLWKPLHEVSFVLWFILMVPHVFAYLLRATNTSYRELIRLKSKDTKASTSSWNRSTLVLIALGIGVGLGLRFVPYAHSWIAFFTQKTFR